jgi:hypothetical protein
LSRIADVLGLQKEPLFVLAHPEARSLLGTPREAAPRQEQDQAWQEFAGNKALWPGIKSSRANSRFCLR